MVCVYYVMDWYILTGGDILRVQRNMSLEDTLVDRVKVYADKYGLPFSNAVSVLLVKALDQEDMLVIARDQMPEMMAKLDEMQKQQQRMEQKRLE